jgi:DNA-binding winged helix-turn-helix (wHTH) protein
MSLPDVMAERERLSAARTGRASPRRGESAPLPSAPIPNTLPVLCPGVDRLPNGCRHCGSRLLASEPPLADSRYGLLSCTGCGTELAWLDQPLPSSRQPAAGSRQSHTAPPAPAPAPTLISAPEWRLPGCTVACRQGQHDPVTHERYGHAQALASVVATAAPAPQPTEPIRTGCLTVDLVTERVFVDGSDPGLTPTEGAILRYLAAHLDRPCRHADIVRAVWDEEQAESSSKPRPGRPAWHINRSNVLRIRAKLGPAVPLLETVPGIGYRLRFVEP